MEAIRNDEYEGDRLLRCLNGVFPVFNLFTVKVSRSVCFVCCVCKLGRFVWASWVSLPPLLPSFHSPSLPSTVHLRGERISPDAVGCFSFSLFHSTSKIISVDTDILFGQKKKKQKLVKRNVFLQHMQYLQELSDNLLEELQKEVDETFPKAEKEYYRGLEAWSECA